MYIYECKGYTHEDSKATTTQNNAHKRIQPNTQQPLRTRPRQHVAEAHARPLSVGDGEARPGEALHLFFCMVQFGG